MFKTSVLCPGRKLFPTGATVLEVHESNRHSRKDGGHHCGHHVPKEVLHRVNLLYGEVPRCDKYTIMPWDANNKKLDYFPLDNIPVWGIFLQRIRKEQAVSEHDATLWTVLFTGKVRKQRAKLPLPMVAALDLLYTDLTIQGPELLTWPHYGKIVGKVDTHHCHLNKGKPRYVAVWKVTNRTIKQIEIRYAGTHENADYRRID